MKSPKTMLGIVSIVALTTVGCYHERVVREPAGATTRTTVRETVTVDDSLPAPVVAAPVVEHRTVAAPVVEERTVVTSPTVRETVIIDAPPTPRVETVGVAPTGGHAWVPGHWAREGDRWVWISGRWELRPTPTSVYVPGHWVARGEGYVWQEGYWK